MVKYNKSHVKHWYLRGHQGSRHNEEMDDYDSDDETIESEYTDITDSTDGNYEPEVWESNIIEKTTIPMVNQSDTLHPMPIQKLEPTKYTKLTVLNKTNTTTQIKQNTQIKYNTWSEVVKKVV